MSEAEKMPSGSVKWFNKDKGFGFILADGQEDVFVHISAVRHAGLSTLEDGQRVQYELSPDKRTGKAGASNLTLVVDRPAPAAPARLAHEPVNRPRGAVRGAGVGVVKWFDAARGFGFITPQEGGEEIFVHVATVEKSGLRRLAEGQAVAYDFEVDARRGTPTVINLRVKHPAAAVKLSSGPRAEW